MVLYCLTAHSFKRSYTECRVGITDHKNQFSEISAPVFNTDPNLELLSNSLAVCRSFNFENQIINKHVTDTSVNICNCARLTSTGTRSIYCHPTLILANIQVCVSL